MHHEVQQLKETWETDPSSLTPETLGGQDEGSDPNPEGSDPSIMSPPMDSADDGWRSNIITSEALLEEYRERLVDPSTMLWGHYIRAGMVTLFVGETSAGKTTLLHTLSAHLASGKPFLGLAPIRPIRVLYVDFESPPDVIAEHLSNVGVVPGWDFFKIYREEIDHAA